MARLAAHGLVFLRAGRRPAIAPRMGIQPQLEPPTNFCVIAEKPSAFPQPLSAFLPLLASSVFCGAKGSNPGPFPELYSSPVSTFSMDGSFLSPPQVTMQMTWDEGTLYIKTVCCQGLLTREGLCTSSPSVGHTSRLLWRLLSLEEQESFGPSSK